MVVYWDSQLGRGVRERVRHSRAVVMRREHIGRSGYTREISALGGAAVRRYERAEKERGRLSRESET